MGKLKSRIQESHVWRRYPKLSLGLAPSLISFELGISLVVGYLIAFVFAGARTNTPGRIPSLVFRIRQYRIHLHHWFVFSNILVALLFMHFFVLTPLLFYGFLGGVVAQGVFHYEDWHTIIQKVY
jgi:hypothetical protein